MPYLFANIQINTICLSEFCAKKYFSCPFFANWCFYPESSWDLGRIIHKVTTYFCTYKHISWEIVKPATTGRRWTFERKWAGIRSVQFFFIYLHTQTHISANL